MTLHWLHLPTYLFNIYIIASVRDIIRKEILLALAFLTNLRRYCVHGWCEEYTYTT